MADPVASFLVGCMVGTIISGIGFLMVLMRKEK